MSLTFDDDLVDVEMSVHHDNITMLTHYFSDKIGILRSGIQKNLVNDLSPS